MTTLTVQAKDKKHLSKIKQALKLVDANFETKETAYNPEFVKKINDRMGNIKKGEYITVTDKYKNELFNL
jgi:hypothetical protein